MTEAGTPQAVTPHDASAKIKLLVAGLAEALVDHPDQITVEAIVQDDSTLIRLSVAAADIGKVIGKQGRTARSIRTILSAASMKLHHRFALDILEDGRTPEARPLV